MRRPIPVPKVPTETDSSKTQTSSTTEFKVKIARHVFASQRPWRQARHGISCKYNIMQIGEDGIRQYIHGSPERRRRCRALQADPWPYHRKGACRKLRTIHKYPLKSSKYQAPPEQRPPRDQALPRRARGRRPALRQPDRFVPRIGNCRALRPDGGFLRSSQFPQASV